MSQNPHIPGSVSNFNMHQSVRPLGPPNVRPQNGGNVGPYPSQPPHPQGLRPNGPSFGTINPPNNTPLNHSLVNGQGSRPSAPTQGLGKLD